MLFFQQQKNTVTSIFPHSHTVGQDNVKLLTIDTDALISLGHWNMAFYMAKEDRKLSVIQLQQEHHQSWLQSILLVLGRTNPCTHSSLNQFQIVLNTAARLASPRFKSSRQQLDIIIQSKPVAHSQVSLVFMLIELTYLI